MNKFLAYTLIAIMLGTVTMLAPLALLGTGDPNLTETPALESTGNNRTAEGAQTLNGENWTDAMAPSESEYSDSSSQYTITAKTAEDNPDLSPIGLMVVPSFLVALGVFVLLRKRAM